MFQMPNSTVVAWRGHHPKLAKGVFVAAGAVVIGQVELGEGASIWFNTVIRGDVNTIKIGARMGAIILDGAIIRSRCMVAAGTVVPPGKEMPSGMLVMGAPAKVVRPLTAKELEFLGTSAQDYVQTAQSYFVRKD